MTATEFDHSVADWSRWLVGKEAVRAGVTKACASERVARRLRVAPGKIERCVKGRVKGVRIHFFEAVKALVIKEMRSEIERLEHEIAMARAIGGALVGDEMAKALSALESAREHVRVAER